MTACDDTQYLLLQSQGAVRLPESQLAGAGEAAGALEEWRARVSAVPAPNRGAHPAVPVLLILLIATIVEVAVLVAVGDLIGVLPTIGLLILASVVGAWLLRREGTRTLGAFSEAVRTRRPPHRELVDGVLIAAAGVLIVVPGFVSDVLALVLLLPPTRALVRGRMVRSASRHAPVRLRTGTVVDGEVVQPDPDTRRPEGRPQIINSPER